MPLLTLELLEGSWVARSGLACVGSYNLISVVLYLGYYGTQYSVRLSPRFGYSILYEEYIMLLGSTTKKNATHLGLHRTLNS